MYSFISKLDRDIARSFLNAPTNTISYTSVPMRDEQNHVIKIPSQTTNDDKENFFDDILRQSNLNTQLSFPTNTSIIPMYCDVIVDTVTDYDIFYPIAKQTEKYYYNTNNDQEIISNENSIYPRYHVQRLDEFSVSIDFPYDYDSKQISSYHSIQNQQYPYERLHPIKNVRFNDNPICIPYTKNHIENPTIPIDQYYFSPETISQVNNQQSSIRYINTPFFWFRPVLNHNYAICIPTSRPSLHAYVTSSFNPIISQYQSNSISNPIRL